MLSSLGVAIFCSIKYSEVIVLIQYPPLILKIHKYRITVRKLKTIPFLEREKSGECKYAIKNNFRAIYITEKGR